MNEAPVVGTSQWPSTWGTRPSQIASAMTSRAAPAQSQPSRVRRVPRTPVPAIEVSAAGWRMSALNRSRSARARAGKRPASATQMTASSTSRIVRERPLMVEQQRDRDDSGAHHDRARGGRDRVEDAGPDRGRPVRLALHQRAVW